MLATRMLQTGGLAAAMLVTSAGEPRAQATAEGGGGGGGDGEIRLINKGRVLGLTVQDIERPLLAKRKSHKAHSKKYALFTK